MRSRSGSTTVGRAFSRISPNPPGKLFITAQGFGTQVLFSRPVNSYYFSKNSWKHLLAFKILQRTPDISVLERCIFFVYFVNTCWVSVRWYPFSGALNKLNIYSLPFPLPLWLLLERPLIRRRTSYISVSVNVAESSGRHNNPLYPLPRYITEAKSIITWHFRFIRRWVEHYTLPIFPTMAPLNRAVALLLIMLRFIEY